MTQSTPETNSIFSEYASMLSILETTRRETISGSINDVVVVFGGDNIVVPSLTTQHVECIESFCRLVNSFLKHKKLSIS